MYHVWSLLTSRKRKIYITNTISKILRWCISKVSAVALSIPTIFHKPKAGKTRISILQKKIYSKTYNFITYFQNIRMTQATKDYTSSKRMRYAFKSWYSGLPWVLQYSNASAM
jgi:hypothetical protein